MLCHFLQERLYSSLYSALSSVNTKLKVYRHFIVGLNNFRWSSLHIFILEKIMFKDIV